MSRLHAVFARAAEERRAALVVYLCAGDPSLGHTADLIVAAAEAGADVVEVGVPFSDPTADGPTIQRASERALRNGATLSGVLAAVAAARARTEVPIVLFGYFNPILRFGEARLAREAKAAGVDGLLVVDLPPESGDELLAAASSEGIDFVPLIAPTSTPERVARAGQVAGAFIYYVSMTGVTGAAGADLASAAERAREVRQATGRPVAVGFGVRSPADVAAVAAHADAVVVGSAIVEAIERSPDAPAAAVSSLVAALTPSLRKS